MDAGGHYAPSDHLQRLGDALLSLAEGKEGVDVQIEALGVGGHFWAACEEHHSGPDLGQFLDELVEPGTVPEVDGNPDGFSLGLACRLFGILGEKMVFQLGVAT